MFLDLTDRSVDVSAGASDMTRLPIVLPGRQTAAAAVRSRALILTLGIALGVSGCSAPRSSAPTAPTPVSIATTAATHLLGVVEDSAFRPLTGVRVEVADGPQAGASAISTDQGNFEVSGTSAGSVTLRATKDGFSTTTKNASWRPASDRQLVTVIWNRSARRLVSSRAITRSLSRPIVRPPVTARPRAAASQMPS